MNKKAVSIPTEVIEPQFDNFFVISYYKNKTDAKKENLSHIKLPRWVGRLINEKVESEKRRAVIHFKKDLNMMLN